MKIICIIFIILAIILEAINAFDMLFPATYENLRAWYNMEFCIILMVIVSMTGWISTIE